MQYIEYEIKEINILYGQNIYYKIFKIYYNMYIWHINIYMYIYLYCFCQKTCVLNMISKNIFKHYLEKRKVNVIYYI